MEIKKNSKWHLNLHNVCKILRLNITSALCVQIFRLKLIKQINDATTEF
jgi:hypothetical protein